MGFVLEGVVAVIAVTAGGVLFTVNVADGPAPASVLPARSDDVPACTEIPKVPLPVMPESVTV